MNNSQKRILMATIALVVAMIAYPPFHVVLQNGLVFNMGYNWLLDPPKRGSIVAIVNVSMLLMQWVGVLVVGGLAFFLAKNSTQVPPISGAGAINRLPVPPQNANSTGKPVKARTKLRLLGGAILLFNIWAIGTYSIEGITALLMTFGFAIAYEYLLVRRASE